MSCVTGSEDCVAIFALHYLLPPAKIGSKKSTWKPSIQDSIETVIIHAKEVGEVNQLIEEKKKKCLSNGTTLQPLIVIIGEQITSLEYFFIYIEDIKYKLSTFKKCFDILFKMYQVLNLKYPPESINVLTFIQKQIYNIDLNQDIKTPNLLDLITKFN